LGGRTRGGGVGGREGGRGGGREGGRGGEREGGHAPFSTAFYQHGRRRHGRHIYPLDSTLYSRSLRHQVVHPQDSLHNLRRSDRSHASFLVPHRKRDATCLVRPGHRHQKLLFLVPLPDGSFLVKTFLLSFLLVFLPLLFCLPSIPPMCQSLPFFPCHLLLRRLQVIPLAHRRKRVREWTRLSSRKGFR
jgi:hypothetical protein